MLSVLSSCVGNVFCDPNKSTKKEKKDTTKFMFYICLAKYTNGDFTPTAAQDPKYADPSVAAAEAQKRLIDCTLLLGSMANSGSQNPSVCD